MQNMQTKQFFVSFLLLSQSDMTSRVIKTPIQTKFSAQTNSEPQGEQLPLTTTQTNLMIAQGTVLLRKTERNYLPVRFNHRPIEEK